MKKTMYVLAGLMVAVFLTAGKADALVLDLTTFGSDGFINGAYFEQLDTTSTGSGVIESFVRLGDNTANIAEGYNTSGRPLAFTQVDTLTFTHDLLLSDIPVVTLNNITYYQFLLDVNEPGSASGAFISLDSLKIYTSLVGGLNPSDPNALGTLVYNMDAGVDSYVKLNANLNSGSGSGDMFFYAQTSLFSGDYVYLYSKFGSNYAATAGFEEWAILKGETVPPNPTPIPEPATMMLMASGLAGLGLRRNKK